MVQRTLADVVSRAVGEKLGTKVEVKRIDLGFFNRIIADGFVVYDQTHKPMLSTTRLSARIEIIPLLQGRIQISSAQVFGLNLNLNRKDASQPLNCQFALDSLASKDTTESHTDLHIASLVVRNGSVKYDQYDSPTLHYNVSNISSHAIIYALRNDRIDAELKNLSLKEAKGFTLNKLAFRFHKSPLRLNLRQFHLELPGSSVSIPYFTIFTHDKTGNLDPQRMTYEGKITASRFSASDFQAFTTTNISQLEPVKFAATITPKNNGSLFVKSLSNSLSLSLGYTFRDIATAPRWNVRNIKMLCTEKYIRSLSSAFEGLPQQLLEVGDIKVDGTCNGMIVKHDTASVPNVYANLNLSTTKAGKVSIKGDYLHDKAKLIANLDAFNLGIITAAKELGTITAEVKAEGVLDEGKPIYVKTLCNIGEINALGYDYHGIDIDAKYRKSNRSDIIDLKLNSDDDNLQASVDGMLTLTDGSVSGISGNSNISRIVPKTLNLTDEWDNSSFSFSLEADVQGSQPDNMTGSVLLSDFTIHGAHKSLLNADQSKREDVSHPMTLSYFNISSTKDADGMRETFINSDFCNMKLEGTYTFSTLPMSFINLVKRNLTTIPGIDKIKPSYNDFTVKANISSLDFIHRMTGADIKLDGDAQLTGYLRDSEGKANMMLTIPSLDAYGYSVKNFKFLSWSPDKTLYTTLSTEFAEEDNFAVNLNLESHAVEDNLNTKLKWNSLNNAVFSGELNTSATSNILPDGTPSVVLSIKPSDIHVGDSIWHLHSNDIVYTENKLSIDEFAIGNENQHVYINGLATPNEQDSMVVDLKNIKVDYIMNLVDFHSVEFAGIASGKAVGHGLMSHPEANAKLLVRDFLFDNGHLGTLDVTASLNNELEQIDIDGVTKDEVSELGIKGYVSVQRGELDLELDAKNTRLDFMETYCGSFMDNVNVYGDGLLRLYGPFSALNLVGDAFVHGDLDITTLGCHYTLPGDSVHLLVDDMQIHNQPIVDKRGNTCLISGGLHHRNLGRMTFDFDFDAKNFLAYDFHEFGNNVFYGTAYMDGHCNLQGRSSELNVTVNGKAGNGSIIVYNASSPDAVTNQDFITWSSASAKRSNSLQHKTQAETSKDDDVSTNIHMYFNFDIDEGSTLRVMMDEGSNEHIDLNGRSSLRAQYYNKGAFDIFGNFEVTRGKYHLPIQHVIMRDFEFLPGGSISFNGNPFSASLNLLARYSLPSVPLSDLNIGESFSNNNVRVDCILQILGTAGNPTIAFDMDLPTVNSDAKQMIYSLINSEEEKEQQVFYLLAVGRFLAQGTNNATTQDVQQTSRTSKALQSILSGTLSQQIGSALGSVLNSSKWTVGANISPGDEGFSNAEYEGLVKGSLLDNRLLINGQFGYRDNALTSNQEIIGDFDVQYLITRNGNISARVYNQTNDRYFTRNSLTTQGAGFIFKTDFNSWRDIFRRKK